LKVDILVVGAGPTGIGAALNLAGRGRDYLLVESERTAGGLAGSTVDAQGFTWDFGGHVQFSHYDRFDGFMDRALGTDGWLDHVRESWIWMAGRFVPYPLQSNLGALPAAERERCADGLREAVGRGERGATNFRQWIDATFGSGIAELFMVPYNLKTWAHPLEMMGTQWVGDRVALPSRQQLDALAAGTEGQTSWGPNSRFRFPRSGGTGAVWRALCATLDPTRVRLGETVSAIEAGERTARLASGESISYQHLISTMPLDRLASMATLGELEGRAAALRHSSTHVVGIGLRGRPGAALATKNWIYFPEANAPFYRVTVFNNYSPANVPSPDCWSLMAEVSESAFKPVSHHTVVDTVLEGMLATGLVGAESVVVSRWHRFLPYGYPIPTVDRDAILAAVLPALDELGIHSRGRFGAWKYEVGNQDHSFMQGWECVDRICAGAGPEVEVTVNRPEHVNRPR
jgi:protoporphyrinogen oxidase